MRIKSGVWHWLAAGCGLTGLLVGMGIEGGAQLGGVITDGEVCTALGLLAAAVLFMRLGFAAQDREQRRAKAVEMARQHYVECDSFTPYHTEKLK